MVDLNGINFIMEAKDSQGEHLFPPIPLQRLSVEPSLSSPLYTHYRGELHVFHGPIRRDGKVKIKFYGEPSQLGPMMYRENETLHNTVLNPVKGDLYFKQSPDAESFNVYKNCFLTSINWEMNAFDGESDLGLTAVEAEFIYQDSDAVLNLPAELREDQEWANERFRGRFQEASPLNVNTRSYPPQEVSIQQGSGDANLDMWYDEWDTWYENHPEEPEEKVNWIQQGF